MNPKDVRIGARIVIDPQVNSAWAGIGMITSTYGKTKFTNNSSVQVTMETGECKGLQGGFSVDNLRLVTPEGKIDRKEKGRRILKLLANYLNVADNDSRAMWDIITALRGPDITNGLTERLKENTTSRLRYAIGLKKELGSVDKLGIMIRSETPSIKVLYETVGEPFEYTQDAKKAGYHFTSHYKCAVFGLNRLGLLEEEE